MGGLLVFIFVAAALLIVVASCLGRRWESSREVRLRNWAADEGLQFESDVENVPEVPYKTFAVFNPAGEQARSLTISGETTHSIGGHVHTCPICLGDIRQEDEAKAAATPLWFRIASGPSYVEFSYLLLRLPFKHVPPMRIRHRRGPGGSTMLAGRNQLKFEWEEFNRTVQVTCPDRRFGSDLIWKHMMEFLLEYPSFPLAVEKGWISMTDAHTKWTPSEYCEAKKWMREFLALWPEHLVVTLSQGLHREETLG